MDLEHRRWSRTTLASRAFWWAVLSTGVLSPMAWLVIGGVWTTARHPESEIGSMFAHAPYLIVAGTAVFFFVMVGLVPSLIVGVLHGIVCRHVVLSSNNGPIAAFLSLGAGVGISLGVWFARFELLESAWTQERVLWSAAPHLPGCAVTSVAIALLVHYRAK
jgi:hypothetical protein